MELNKKDISIQFHPNTDKFSTILQSGFVPTMPCDRRTRKKNAVPPNHYANNSKRSYNNIAWNSNLIDIRSGGRCHFIASICHRTFFRWSGSLNSPGYNEPNTNEIWKKRTKNIEQARNAISTFYKATDWLSMSWIDSFL